MSAKLEVNPTDFDARMVEWNLKHSKITREQLNAYLASLPDDAVNAESVQFEDGDDFEGSNGTS